MPRYLICKIEDGEPVAFLASAAFNQVQTVGSPLGAREFNSIALVASYTHFWQSLEPWAVIRFIEVSELSLVQEVNEEIEIVAHG